MLIWPPSLSTQERHDITTPLCGDKCHFPGAAQMVHRQKHLVPCKIGTAACQIFEVAGLVPIHDIDDLIFHGRV